VGAQPSMSFAGLLWQLRLHAGLTQEELAEAAEVSARSVSDLERGINMTARKETARLLANALNLAGPSDVRSGGPRAGLADVLHHGDPDQPAADVVDTGGMDITNVRFVGFPEPFLLDRGVLRLDPPYFTAHDAMLAPLEVATRSLVNQMWHNP
jgi:transcriptional regulator with XRE-family HTH domain